MNTKSATIAALAQTTGLTKSDVSKVLDAMTEQAVEELKTSGEYRIHGLVKLKAKSTPGTADRAGINPFTKLPVTIKGKPASLKVRAAAVPALKAAVAK